MPRSFFGLLRQMLVVTVGVAFIAGAWLSRARSTSWEETLWVTVYPISADSSVVTRDYIDALDRDAFAAIEQFFAEEAARYGVETGKPLRMDLGRPVDALPPAPPESRNTLGVALWSLRLRLWAYRAAGEQPGPTPDIRMFVVYHDPAVSPAVPHSLGLQKGMLGVVHAFADRRMNGSNQFVIAHEILHTLGATDKYDADGALPRYPEGYAEPNRVPRYPQRRAELMGGRIPVSESEAETPASLREAIIGPLTATELRWR